MFHCRRCRFLSVLLLLVTCACGNQTRSDAVWPSPPEASTTGSAAVSPFSMQATPSGSSLASSAPPAFSPLPAPSPPAYVASPPAAASPARPSSAAAKASRKPAATAEARQSAKTGAAQAGSRKKQPSRAAGLLIRSGPAASRKAALTFDDAPDERFTPQILAILAKHKVKATFFLLGTLAKQHPDMVARIVQGGHVVGNHMNRHAYLPKLSDEAYRNDLQASEQVLQSLIGYAPRLLRPPYGAIRPDQLLWAAEQHYVTVNWDVDSQDWRGLTKEQVKANVLGHVHPGCIILQHSGTGASGNLAGTVQALPEIIAQLRSMNYELVTIPELLGVAKEK